MPRTGQRVAEGEAPEVVSHEVLRPQAGQRQAGPREEAEGRPVVGGAAHERRLPGGAVPALRVVHLVVAGGGQ